MKKSPRQFSEVFSTRVRGSIILLGLAALLGPSTKAESAVDPKTDYLIPNVFADIAEATLPSVVADPFQIQQVVLNLAHNGMQAMDGLPMTSRRVTIQTLLGDNGEVKVVVHDSGNEITSETLERMFDPFFTTKPTGLGMGLSLCRSIAEAHGGKLWAKSDKESETEFHFVLPTAEENRLHVA